MSEHGNKVKFTVQVTVEQKAWIDQVAADEDRSISSVIRRLIDAASDKSP